MLVTMVNDCTYHVFQNGAILRELFENEKASFCRKPEYGNPVITEPVTAGETLTADHNNTINNTINNTTYLSGNIPYGPKFSWD